MRIEKKKAKGLSGWGVLKIDFENAYNTLDRGAIEKVLKEEFPELLNWFRFCYGVPAVLSCQGKKLPFASKAGIQQGDPLGPLYFACGILILCRRIKAELKDSLSLWYLDDGSMAGPGEELLRAWKIVEEEAKKIGMRVNVKKCEIWSPEGREKWQDEFPEQVVRLKAEGFELLGAPIGTKEFCEEYARKRVMKVKEVVAKLPLLADPQMELVLLRSCIGLPKFGFTLRSAPPEDIQTATKEFDDLMEKTSEERFGIQMGKEAALQWHLPVRMGGVGISRAQDVSAPAYLGNVLLALPFLRKLVEEDLDVEEVPGASYAWDLLKEKVLESEDELPEECEEHLRELKLVFPPDVLRKMTKGPNALEEIFEETKEKADEDGSEKKKKNKVKHQHFLHSLIHVKRLRQWLEVKHDEWENEEIPIDGLCDSPPEGNAFLDGGDAIVPVGGTCWGLGRRSFPKGWLRCKELNPRHATAVKTVKVHSGPAPCVGGSYGSDRRFDLGKPSHRIATDWVTAGSLNRTNAAGWLWWEGGGPAALGRHGAECTVGP